ncbi:MAG: hypothetical protein K2K50_01975, partial [Anaeroplasmataceae bacterium]|nr:hypothetical protein [Anaeroplasmataceae bacterium]
MKILIGVCGIGKGHCIRQYEICKALINRGHEVRVLTYLEGINFFEKTDIKFYKVFVPLVLYKGDKLDIFNCLRRNFCVFIPGLIKNRKVMRSLFKEGFIPDVCISDYEPIVAKISYKLKKPLLNIDQQSKFIYMDKEIIHGFSCVEEKKRLNLFFPKYNNKYIVSFYNLKNINLPQNVEVLYPIIAEDIRNKQLQIKTKNKIIVYFSKFIDIPIRQTYVEVIN